MTQAIDGFHMIDPAIRDGVVTAASAYGENFTRWAKRYAFELEELFEIGGPKHFGKAKRQVAWLAERIFSRKTPPFDPEMSFEYVIETYCKGHVFGGLHDYLSDLLSYHAQGVDEDAPFPAPWIEGGVVAGYISSSSPRRTRCTTRATGCTIAWPIIFPTCSAAKPISITSARMTAGLPPSSSARPPAGI